jgi:phosphoglycerol transferase
VGNPAQGIPPASPLQDEGSYLGIVGLLALGLLAWTAIADVVKSRANDIPLAAWQVLWIVLCFTTGGLNAILGAFGFTLFRTGQRYSIVILAIALLYAAQRLTAWQKDAAGRTAPDVLRIGTLTAAAAMSTLILWDQVPRAPAAEQTAMIARQVAADREFTEKMETALPAGAMVFQLPVMDFPESPLPGIPSYDHFRPYLYSNQLRFSYGSMKGRERERWQHDLQRQLVEGAAVNQEAKKIQFNAVNVRRAVDELQKLGFKAIYINRNGFPDRGRGLEEALLELGYTKPVIRNATGDLACILL